MIQLQKKIPSREDLVYEALKDSILSGQFKPSEVINQTDLARQLGVSIIPVRTAISRLVTEGLLTQDSYHSPQVSALSKGELEEILVICMQLEILAMKEAIPHIGPRELEPLQSLLEEMSTSIQQGDLTQYGNLNRQFHMAIYEHCPYPRLRQMIADLWTKVDINQYRSMYDLVPDLARHTQEDHVRLLHLIETQQVNEAVQLMEEHKRYSRNGFLTTFSYLE
jgi:DNA-binding GntR family transcriptional regulator